MLVLMSHVPCLGSCRCILDLQNSCLETAEMKNCLSNFGDCETGICIWLKLQYEELQIWDNEQATL
ncbi:hypothetical protein X975_08682, partial [Stegodyphus mimosarum]